MQVNGQAFTLRQFTDLGSDGAFTKLEHKPVDAAESEVPLEDHVDPFGFFVDDRELAVLELIS